MIAFDAIVIGVGGMGSSALYHLAQRGVKALGVEQFSIGHDRGSSHGATRLIRRAYFEHPDYVPLVDRAYTLWGEVEKAASRKLLHRCGLMLAGQPDGAIIHGVRRAARDHDLDIEAVDHATWPGRFPAFSIDPDMEVLLEADAGFLEVENCVRAYVELARSRGATVLTGQRVRDWSADARGVSVSTDDEHFTARHLIFCGGAWTSSLLSSLQLPLTVRRKVVVWFAAGEAFSHARGCPVFGFETDGGFYYGFPAIDELGVKVSDHMGGQTNSIADALDREVRAADEEPLRRFVERHAPRLGTAITKRSVCMYTMTPDEHFILDRHAEHANVFYACGFSGHGFKFAPVIGKVLADWVTDGRSQEPIKFLRAARLGL
jgi:sarcosine oxidase